MPERKVRFDSERENYTASLERSNKLAEVMGYRERRIVEHETTSSDLAVFGLNYLLDSGRLAVEDLGALIVVTQTPDFLIPGTSHVIHGRLGLPEDVYCVDQFQGCSGFITGFIEAALLARHLRGKVVVVVNVDVLSRKVNPKDRNSYPLIGDACAITVYSETDVELPSFAIANFDGSKGSALKIPAGGLHLPSSSKTKIEKEDEDGNVRSLDDLKMEGKAVYNFVISKVPSLLSDLKEFAGVTDASIRKYFFHQPNRFLLNQLVRAASLDSEKVPTNVVEQFGNSSGATIPVNMWLNSRPELLRGKDTYCLAGFGVGLSWAGLITTIGPLDFCEMVEF